MGRGLAHAFAAAGAHVLVNDLWLERAEAVVEEIRAAGRAGDPLAFDVTDYDAVTEAAALGGHIGILVNNAGNAGAEAPRLGAVPESEPLRRDALHPCSAACDHSSWITGQTIPVNGGFSFAL